MTQNQAKFLREGRRRFDKLKIRFTALLLLIKNKGIICKGQRNHSFSEWLDQMNVSEGPKLKNQCLVIIRHILREPIHMVESQLDLWIIEDLKGLRFLLSMLTVSFKASMITDIHANENIIGHLFRKGSKRFWWWSFSPWKKMLTSS